MYYSDLVLFMTYYTRAFHQFIKYYHVNGMSFVAKQT